MASRLCAQSRYQSHLFISGGIRTRQSTEAHRRDRSSVPPARSKDRTKSTTLPTHEQRRKFFIAQKSKSKPRKENKQNHEKDSHKTPCTLYVHDYRMVLHKIEIESLYEAISRLSWEHQQYIIEVYLSKCPLTDIEYAEHHGLTQWQVVYMKEKIFHNLRFQMRNICELFPIDDENFTNAQ